MTCRLNTQQQNRNKTITSEHKQKEYGRRNNKEYTVNPGAMRLKQAIHRDGMKPF